MKPKELRELTRQELETKMKEEEEKLFRLTFEKHSGQIKNPLRIRFMKRDIARMKTLLKEKKS